MRVLHLCLAGLLLSTVARATGLPADITSDRTLTAAASPYTLQSDVTIAAGVTVTVEPGVQVVAAGNFHLFVSGTLTGTDYGTNPIVFRALDGSSRGAWGGLFVDGAGTVKLTGATIQNAVYNVSAPGGKLQLNACTLRLASADSVLAWQAAALDFSGCVFADNSGRGLTVDGYEASGNIRYCAFRNNGSYPVMMKATFVEMLRWSNTFSGNAIQRIGVSCSMVDDIADVDTWDLLPIPFELGAGGGEQTLTIAKTARLTIKAGNTIYGSRVDCKGILEVNGSPEVYTTFMSGKPTPAPGDWEGLVCYTGSNYIIQYARIRDAATGLTADGGNGYILGMVIERCRYDGARFTGSAYLSLLGAGFNDNGRNGLRLEDQRCRGKVAGCRFAGNGSYPVWVVSRDVYLLATGNAYTDNGLQMIGVNVASGISGTVTWENQGIPLDCTADSNGVALVVPIGAALTIRAGQTLYLNGLENWGYLAVEGGSTSPCYFLPPPTLALPGSWSGIRYAPGSKGSLDGAVVSLAVTGLTIKSVSPRLRECVVQFSQFDGVQLQGTATPIIVGSSFTGNGRHGIMITDTARPNLGSVTNIPTNDDGHNTLRNNAGYDLYNNTAQSITAQGNTWSSDDPAAVATRIFDRADLSTKGPVTYTPLRSAANTQPPVLAWAGSAGYEQDGVSPDAATPTNTITFKVKYSDPEGFPAHLVLLHLARGNDEVSGSPFVMTTSGNPDYAGGAVFAYACMLPAGRDYRYWFTAADGLFAATGPPGAPLNGPVVNSGPVLSFAGPPNYGNDGVNPDSGSPGTTFAFRCKYSDADNEAPQSIVCHILQSGTPISGSPFDMVGLSTNPYSSGRVYEAHQALKIPGSYSYRFEATDGAWPATGPATATLSGPTVAAGGLALQALTAQQVSAGVVSVQWRLTAPAGVDVEVRNLAGRVVAVLSRRQPYDSGPATLLWNRCLTGDGRSPSQGARTPPGQYLLVLTAYGAAGSRWQTIAPLTLR